MRTISPGSKRPSTRFLGILAVVFLSALFVLLYTFGLQSVSNESILNNEVQANVKRTDAMHKGVSSFLTREDFTDINDKSDMGSEHYRSLQAKLNQVRSMNSTRYFYTAKRNEEGRLVYLVDGLDLGSEDFAYPGSDIEEEMVPYIDAALRGETVYSHDIVDTTWGHIFTACYPVYANDDSDDVLGALCIEMDMEPTYAFISQRNTTATFIGLIGAATAVLLVVVFWLSRRRMRSSERKRQQLVYEAAQAAESANRAKSIFLFNMSHDIRTPMNAIIGFTELAERHLDEPERLRGYLSNIRVCGGKLLSLLNNVLDLARIENDQTVLEEKACKVDGELDSSILMFRSEAEKKDITISVEKDLRFPFVYADERSLSEVGTNLLSNAVKYTENGGSITCRLSDAPSEKEGWCVVELVVSDTGIGMSEEFQSKVFEAFSRERSATDSGVEGSGLGLGIVKKLVDLMGGTIKVESTLGVGSCFTVRIPCRVASSADVAACGKAQDVDVSKLQGKRILLAEDNDLNAEIAIDLLGEAGLVVERAENGAVCVDMLESAPAGYYDVVLMDIQMPVMDGYSAAARIRHLDDAARAGIPIIAMTANAFVEDKNRAVKAGMNDHVPKPINVDVLLSAIVKCLE